MAVCTGETTAKWDSKTLVSNRMIWANFINSNNDYLSDTNPEGGELGCVLYICGSGSYSEKRNEFVKSIWNQFQDYQRTLRC